MKREDFKNIDNGHIATAIDFIKKGYCHGTCEFNRCPFSYPYNNKLDTTTPLKDLSYAQVGFYMTVRNCPVGNGNFESKFYKLGYGSKELTKACNEFIQMFSVTKLDLTE